MLSPYVLFLKEYFFHFREVGAILPSSSYLSKAMIQHINWSETKVVVEAGAGTGVFTDEIIKQMSSETTLFVFELNDNLRLHLKEKYTCNSNIIIEKDIRSLSFLLKRHGCYGVDLIISGLPFRSLPQTVSNDILKEFNYNLNKNGILRLFQYTTTKKDVFDVYFYTKIINLELRNIPPAFIFQCEKKGDS